MNVFFIIRSYRLAANNTRYLAKQLDAAKGAFQSGVDGYFEQWGLSEAEKDIALFTIKRHDHFRDCRDQTNQTEYDKDAV